jgi:hypothetical protein
MTAGHVEIGGFRFHRFRFHRFHWSRRDRWLPVSPVDFWGPPSPTSGFDLRRSCELSYARVIQSGFYSAYVRRMRREIYLTTQLCDTSLARCTSIYVYDFSARSSKLSSRSLRVGNEESMHTMQLNLLRTTLYTTVSGYRSTNRSCGSYRSLNRRIDQHCCIRFGRAGNGSDFDTDQSRRVISWKILKNNLK